MAVGIITERDRTVTRRSVLDGAEPLAHPDALTSGSQARPAGKRSGHTGRLLFRLLRHAPTQRRPTPVC